VPERHASYEWSRAGHYGAAGGGVALAEAMIACAWNAQGDARSARFADQARRLFGVALPLSPGTIARNEAATALWFGPASWLLLSPLASSPFADFDAKREALGAAGGALFDVTASRIAWTISGPHADSVLAKSCPLDFDQRAFAPGTCAQSLLGHVPALFVRSDAAFTVLVGRSFARDVWRALTEAAAQYGYDVGLALPFESGASATRSG